MEHFKRLGGTDGIKAIAGSAFFWAWFDALFMSALFPRAQTSSTMPEYAMVLAFAFSLPVLALTVWKRPVAQRLIESRRALMGFAAVGSAGSLLYVAAGISGNWAALIAGGVFCGTFMGAFGSAWGVVYARVGTRLTTLYVAGAFAAAPMLDIPLLLMIPQATAAFFALFPLVSGLVYTLIAKPQRALEPAVSQNSSARERGVRPFLNNHLGLSAMLIVAVMLVMTSFGYLQHLISFSHESSGIAVQIARGVASIAMFFLFAMRPRSSSAVYRVGFLAMIAGIMMVPFALGTEYFIPAGAIIVSGYTAFDIFIWVVFSRIARTQSSDPLKTIALVRFATNATTALGLACGIALVGNGETVSEFAPQETTIVGYFAVIATVLLLSGEGSASLFHGVHEPAQRTAEYAGDMAAGGAAAWFSSIGLTEREREVAGLLIQGRTQPWVAEALNISENTVGTHVRHIYRKAGAHDRQQFIDQALRYESPDSRDPAREVTQPS